MHSILIKEFMSFIDEAVAYKSSPIYNGDILFAASGETPEDIGKSVVFIGEDEAYAGGDIIIFRQKSANALFLAYLFNGEEVNRQRYKFAKGQSVFHLHINDIKRIFVALPSLCEQAKITDILFTCDKGIELKEKLIAGKRQQKKWLLENLLTGRKRLPGFSDKWKEIRLGEVCKEIIGGGTPPRNNKRYYQGNIPWVTVKDLDGARQKYDAIEHVSEEAVQYGTTRVIPKGNLIVSTRMGLGRAFISMVDMAINQDMKGIILDNNLVSTEFVYFSYVQLHNRLERLGNGSTVKGIDVQTLKKLEINLPPLPEQTAIAEILSAVDREIDLHEKHLKELKKQRQALMQLLLTGIVRVNGQEVS